MQTGLLIYTWIIIPQYLNSLALGRCGCYFENVIFEHMLCIKFMGTSCQIAMKWMPWHTFDDESTLVQVMAWCYQPAGPHLSQCYPRSTCSYGNTLPYFFDKWYISPNCSHKFVSYWFYNRCMAVDILVSFCDILVQSYYQNVFTEHSILLAFAMPFKCMLILPFWAHFNVNMLLHQYRKFHCGNMTVLQSS